MFAQWPGVEADSAGLADDAEVVLSADQLEGCDLVCVMERRHLRRLKQRFAHQLRGVRVVCLDIPDDHDYMAPALVAELERKVGPLLRGLARS